MIIKINFSIIQHKDLHTFGKLALEIFKEKTLSGTGVDIFVTRAGASYTNFEKAFERELKNPLTPLLAQKDAERDDAFYAFRSYVEASSFRTREGWNAAAAKILDVIRRHGWQAPHFGYKAETSAITSIIVELRTGYTIELTLLSATELLDELDTSEKAFETIQKEMLIQPQPEGLTIGGTRPVLVNDLNLLFNMVGLQCEATNNPELIAIENSLNELITLTLTAARAAATRKNNKTGEPPATPQP
jgi:hypothetical protein